MNIVFVIDTYNESGGAGVATIRLVNELKKRGHNVKIITSFHENENDLDFFEVPRIVMPFGGKIQHSMQFYFGRNKKSVFWKAMNGADIVQIQFPFLMAKGAFKMAKKLNVPVIGALHIQPQSILLGMGITNKIYEKFIWWIFKYFLFNRVNTIVTPSSFANKLLSSEGIKANIISISNGIPREYTSQKFEMPNWFNNHFVILSVGRHATEKRHALIIEGIKKSKYADDILLILAGKGELTQELRDLGKTLPVQPYIEYISHEDKLRYLNTANLYIHASIIDLESLSTSEAIGCGLPCLISDSPLSAASQFALDDRFLFNADDSENLASKINYWYENRRELESIEMKKKAANKANDYLFETSIDRYEKLYMEMIANK